MRNTTGRGIVTCRKSSRALEKTMTPNQYPSYRGQKMLALLSFVLVEFGEVVLLLRTVAWQFSSTVHQYIRPRAAAFLQRLITRS